MTQFFTLHTGICKIKFLAFCRPWIDSNFSPYMRHLIHFSMLNGINESLFVFLQVCDPKGFDIEKIRSNKNNENNWTPLKIGEKNFASKNRLKSGFEICHLFKQHMAAWGGMQNLWKERWVKEIWDRIKCRAPAAACVVFSCSNMFQFAHPPGFNGGVHIISL